MTNSTPLSALQARLGHDFSDVTLLKRALTHSSVTGARPDVRDLERLEFLGDRVLGLMVAEELWRRYPDMEEGELAPRLNALVRKETCAKAAIAFGLDEMIRLSKAEEAAGGRQKKAILGDVCEAVLGALYVDGGLPAAEKAFEAYWRPNFEPLMARTKDAKTELQEWAQGKGLGAPDYDVLDRGGPDHAPEFDIRVTVQGYPPADGAGPSKRAAQQAAAEAFLLREGLWTRLDV
ncbi:MAG: ribonuclease III [Pseudomonadota bacterium]